MGHHLGKRRGRLKPGSTSMSWEKLAQYAIQEAIRYYFEDDQTSSKKELVGVDPEVEKGDGAKSYFLTLEFKEGEVEIEKIKTHLEALEGIKGVSLQGESDDTK